MKDVTIVYYTANRENEKFEKIITDNILKQKGDIPVISVSQKPMDFGHNICVGIQEQCDTNAFRQLLIGLKTAKTKYVLAAESDCLYPPEYFTFVPPTDDNVYRYVNLYLQWISKRHKPLFYRKSFVEACQICNREYWIKRLEAVMDLSIEWGNYPVKKVFDTTIEYSWTGETPAVYFKTGGGLRMKTPHSKTIEPVREIPYWGSCDYIRKVILDETK